jgi:hypothetical protein
MKKNIIYIAALTVIAAACSNEDALVTVPANNGTSEGKMITETITATNGDANGTTRADVAADATFKWSADDQIAVHVSDGTYHTATLTSGATTTDAEFTVSYEDTYSRNAFAVFPASIVAADAANYGDGTALDVTLPASYTLAEVSGTTTPCPMIAENSGDSWTFKQLCGLLRLTVNNIPATTKRLEIDFNGKKVCGDFSIDSPNPGSSTIETSTDAINDKITITKDGTDVELVSVSEPLVLNIPIPTGTYGNIFVIAYDEISSGTPTILDVISFAKDVERAGGKKKTATMKYLTYNLAKASFDTSLNPDPVPFAYIYQSDAGTATSNTITIAEGQKVIIDGVNIKAENKNAIICEGNAEIVLSGTNTVTSESDSQTSGTLNFAVIKAGTYSETKTTLTISGDGILNAYPVYRSGATNPNHNGAVIGADYEGSCGNIVINSGTITVSNNYGAAIGSGRVSTGTSKCGSITINGGTISATSSTGAGIGSGGRVSGKSGTTSCDGITINGGKVTARSVGGAAIGAGKCEGGGTNSNSYCGNILITGGTIDAQTTNTGDYAGAAIGGGYHSKTGNITISGGNVKAVGSRYSAGIGAGGRQGQCGNILINGGSVDAQGGYGTYEGAGIGTGKGSAANAKSTCGTITITSGVTIVKAKNVVTGSDNKKSIGTGSLSYTQCGTVTIDGNPTITNPFTYEPGAGS